MENNLSEGNIIKNVRNTFRLKKQNKSIKMRIIRDSRNLFESKGESYYEPVRVGNFYGNSLSNMKVMMIETKHY